MFGPVYTWEFYIVFFLPIFGIEFILLNWGKKRPVYLFLLLMTIFASAYYAGAFSSYVGVYGYIRKSITPALAVMGLWSFILWAIVIGGGYFFIKKIRE